jgi:hypothetical protein
MRLKYNWSWTIAFCVLICSPALYEYFLAAHSLLLVSQALFSLLLFLFLVPPFQIYLWEIFIIDYFEFSQRFHLFIGGLSISGHALIEILWRVKLSHDDWQVLNVLVAHLEKALFTHVPNEVLRRRWGISLLLLLRLMLGTVGWAWVDPWGCHWHRYAVLCNLWIELCTCCWEAINRKIFMWWLVRACIL